MLRRAPRIVVGSRRASYRCIRDRRASLHRSRARLPRTAIAFHAGMRLLKWLDLSRLTGLAYHHGPEIRMDLGAMVSAAAAMSSSVIAYQTAAAESMPPRRRH